MTDQSLLSAAQGFLVEALDNHSRRKHQLALLHAVTATELLLKERLARVNSALVFKDIDAKQLAGSQTVALKQIPQRLANLGMPLAPHEAQLINTFAGWRNELVHHLPAFDAQLAERLLPQLLDFLASTLRRDLNSPLESFLPKNLFRVTTHILEDWQVAIRRATDAARAEGQVLDDACPTCGARGVLCLRDDSAVHCHLCLSSLTYDECHQCGRMVASTFPDTADGPICRRCVDDAGDNYINFLIDVARGK